MAYDRNNLSALSYANGFTFWHYRTSDNLSAVLGPKYFNPAHKMLRVGDLIIVHSGDGQTIAMHAVCFVTMNTGGEVEIASATRVCNLNGDLA